MDRGSSHSTDCNSWGKTPADSGANLMNEAIGDAWQEMPGPKLYVIRSLAKGRNPKAALDQKQRVCRQYDHLSQPFYRLPSQRQSTLPSGGSRQGTKAFPGHPSPTGLRDLPKVARIQMDLILCLDGMGGRDQWTTTGC
jgi:hypothetical protein